MPSFEAADLVVARGALIFLATGLLLAWLSLARGWPKLDPAQHWTERARLVFPISQAVLGFAVTWQWLGVITFILVAQPNQRWVQAFAAIGLCRLTLPLVTRLIERRQLGRQSPLWPVFTWALTEAAIAACVVALPGPWRLLGVGAAGALVLASFFGLTVRGVPGRCFGFRPLPAELERVLRAALPAPDQVRSIVVMPSAWVQGIMTWQTMVVTTRALEVLDQRQLSAVAAHEAGHRASWSGLALLLRLGIAAAPWAAFLVLAMAPALGAVVCVLALGLFVNSARSSELLRQDEDRADDHANPSDLAAALERLSEANCSPAVLTIKATHRDLVERLRRLGQVPSWPIPAPPAGFPFTLAQAVLIVASFCISYGYTRPQSDVAGVLRPVFNLPMSAASRQPIDPVIYRHLANGDCASARAAVTETAPASLKRVVEACGERPTGCMSIFELPSEDVAEHVRVANEGSGATLVFDPRHALGLGFKIPRAATGDAPAPLDLRPGSPYSLIEVTNMGIVWRGEEESGVVPWTGLLELSANGRCWRR